MRVHICFDLDGVLIHTRDIILRAYQLAGVTAPANILSLAETSWLEDEVGERMAKIIRRRKDELYTIAIRNGLGVTMNPMNTAIGLQGLFPVHILSGAPRAALDELQWRWGDRWPFQLAVGKMSPRQKFDLMESLGRAIYIDDQKINFDYDKAKVHVIRYTPRRFPDLALHRYILRVAEQMSEVK